MGTRGTLRVYLNDELKIRQYNQWDSYPTGQFDDICQFFREANSKECLAKALSEARLCTREEYDAMAHLDENGEFPKEDGCRRLTASLWLLHNRDYGAGILYQAICMPRVCTPGQPMGELVFPDWAMTFEEGGDLCGEEGNYVIELTADGLDAKNPWRSHPENVRFRLSGEFHGVEREYDWNVIPAEDEVKAWEEEAYKE